MPKMNEIGKTLTSLQVAEMIEKEHRNLVRDIRRYSKQITTENEEQQNSQLKIEQSDFWTESTYKTDRGKEYPCYNITKKGCEFIAHKLTGTKGTIFTARYINKFHEMEDFIEKCRAEYRAGKRQEPELPWFIRGFLGKYVVLERDFIAVTGVDIKKHKLYRNLTGGVDYNAFGWKCNKEEFKKEFGFDFGEDSVIGYFYLSGALKALDILERDKKAKMKDGAYDLMEEGIRKAQKIGRPQSGLGAKTKAVSSAMRSHSTMFVERRQTYIPVKKYQPAAVIGEKQITELIEKAQEEQLPMQINIYVGGTEKYTV